MYMIPVRVASILSVLPQELDNPPYPCLVSATLPLIWSAKAQKEARLS